MGNVRTYEVIRTDDPPQLEAGTTETAWNRANRLSIDQFNWHESGPRPGTTAWLLYDSDALYTLFQVDDRSISSAVTELNGPTYRDSSVELFVDPAPDANSRYWNFEANCCGQFKLAWQEEGWQEREVGRDLIPPDLADEVRVETSVSGPTRKPRADDEEWWLATRLPFETLASFTGVEIAPDTGAEWMANVYRSGVESDEQKATWNPMPTPEPDYHSPAYFGRFLFD